MLLAFPPWGEIKKGGDYIIVFTSFPTFPLGEIRKGVKKMFKM